MNEYIRVLCLTMMTDQAFALQTVVFVADPSLGGNILNFNVGSNIDILVPSNFWSRLAGKLTIESYLSRIPSITFWAIVHLSRQKFSLR